MSQCKFPTYIAFNKATNGQTDIIYKTRKGEENNLAESVNVTAEDRSWCHCWRLQNFEKLPPSRYIEIISATSQRSSLEVIYKYNPALPVDLYSLYNYVPNIKCIYMQWNHLYT